MLRSDLRDYSEAYIAVKRTVTVTGTNNDNTENKKLTFKNNDPFRSCISKANNTFIDNSEDLYIVMPKYNLLEYTDNYSMTSEGLWNYCRDEVNYGENENVANRNMVNNKKITTSKSFKSKTKKIESTPNDGNRLNAEVFVPIFPFQKY